MESMLSEAVRIANDNRYLYSQDDRNKEFYYDCSSFVSRLYQKFFGISRLDAGGASSGTGNMRNNLSGKTVSMSNLQPGDILMNSHHTAIYLGDGKIAEAWGRVDKAEKDQIRVTNLTSGRFTTAYRVVS